MKTLACGLALLISLPTFGREYQAEDPPPERYGDLDWVYQQKIYPGYWYSAEQVQRIELRIRALEDTAAADCFRQTQDANKELLSTKPLVLGGIAIAVGIGLGIFIGKKL